MPLFFFSYYHSYIYFIHSNLINIIMLIDTLFLLAALFAEILKIINNQSKVEGFTYYPNLPEHSQILRQKSSLKNYSKLFQFVLCLKSRFLSSLICIHFWNINIISKWYIFIICFCVFLFSPSKHGFKASNIRFIKFI